MNFSLTQILVIAVFFFAGTINAADFEKDIAPLLVEHCLECHQPNKKSGGLDLTSFNTMKAGGDQGTALVSGKPEESLMIQRIELGEMPPKESKISKAVPTASTAKLREWVREGAKWPANRILGIHEKKVDLELARAFWSFQKVKRPIIPTVEDVSRVSNPIDSFIIKRLEADKLKLSPPATRANLSRRVSLGIRGLPPTVEEQDRFLNDQSPDSYASLVERFLSDPAFGEKWARHWLDLVRYADSNGYERDAAKPSVWKYRDYVIAAFNNDKPYDRFVLEQLAGDELPEPTFETMVATGFHALGTWQDEVDPLEAAQYRADEVDDLIQTTSQTFLGLTLGCARCHNHKFDPLTMVDYYSLGAILSPLKRPSQGRTDVDVPYGNFGKLYRLVESSAKPNPTHLLLSGRASNPGPEMKPQVPAILAPNQPHFPEKGKQTSERRLTFANWMIQPDNPLVARVIVNRVWQHHFGVGLVATSSDFGHMGARPTHPELLDWLAHWFVHDAKWSLKELHRLILLSETYKQDSSHRENAASVDPENKLLWRFPYKRLDIESIRDSMLSISGNLNKTMQGPGVFLPVPDVVVEAHTDKQAAWKAESGAAINRRTIYAFIKRTLTLPLLETFDFCDTTLSSEKRSRTNVAPQALTLFNSEFVNQQADQLALRLERDFKGDPGLQVEMVFKLCLARQPSESEKSAMLLFLQKESMALQLDGTKAPLNARHLAMIQACRVMLNLNEFLYPN